MNSAHDLGGMHGLGPIDPEPEAGEALFRAEWERRVFALLLACGMHGRWTTDSSRHSRERLHPIRYLSNSYYENWLDGLETLLIETGLLSACELSSGRAAGVSKHRAKTPQQVAEALKIGASTQLVGDSEPAFSIGDRVRVVNNHPQGHTRAPRYVRGCAGTVHRLNGVHVFADENAKGNRVGHPLYSIRFEGSELWGSAATGHDAVFADLWEPYLEPA